MAMIHYALTCQQAHEFESWFPSSEAFEQQKTRGLIACPICGSIEVEKQIMAPSVSEKTRQKSSNLQTTQQDTGSVTLLSEREQQMRTLLRTLHQHIQTHAEHVGQRFPEEARKIHYGESEERSIYGEASPEDTRSLLEEGISIMALPNLPDDQN